MNDIDSTSESTIRLLVDTNPVIEKIIIDLTEDSEDDLDDDDSFYEMTEPKGDVQENKAGWLDMLGAYQPYFLRIQSNISSTVKASIISVGPFRDG